MLSGLTADKARPHGDGGGDHARALGAFLTVANLARPMDSTIRAGISVDQVIADDSATRPDCPAWRLVATGLDGPETAIAVTRAFIFVDHVVRSATQPLPKEVSPNWCSSDCSGSGGDAERAKRDARRKSVLDFVRRTRPPSPATSALTTSENSTSTSLLFAMLKFASRSPRSYLP